MIRITGMLYVLFLASSVSAQTGVARVRVKTSENCVLKSSPTVVGNDAVSLKKGTTLFLTDATGEENLVEVVYDRKTYYATRSALRITDEAGAFLEQRKEEWKRRTFWTSQDMTFLGKVPGDSVTREITVYRGTKVFLIREEGQWGYVENPVVLNGQKGWIRRDNLSPVPVSALTWDEVLRMDYLQKHPDLERRFYDAIRASTVLAGMSREMVKVITGPPEKFWHRNDDQDNLIEYWFYDKPFLRITFKNGLVMEVVSSD